MIRTITLNTGFDEIYTVSGLDFGGVTSVIEYQQLASGKGTNAARMIKALGGDVVAYCLIGERDKSLFAENLMNSQVECRLVEVAAPTRRNLTLLREDGATLSAHARARGFQLSDDAPVRELTRKLADDLQPGDIVTLHGSTPIGLATRTWTRIGRAAIERGARLVVDIYGQPLADLLGELPVDVCKPNVEEIQAIEGIEALEGDAAIDGAVTRMLDHRVTLPVVSAGERGVRFGYGRKLSWANAPVLRARVVVGAGDACVAGMTVALSRQLGLGADIVRQGVAAAAAYVEGTPLESVYGRAKELYEQVVVQ